MKKQILEAVLSFIIILGLVVPNTAFAATTPTISATQKTIYSGTTFQLTLKNATGKVKWSSSDEKKVYVLDTGLVVGIKKGKAVITATCDGYRYTCKITVKDPALSKSKETLIKGKELILKVKGDTPDTWKSSDKSVATVNAAGIVNAVGIGKAKITVKCESGKSYNCDITVKNPSLKVGDIIKMGKTEQDNNSYNGEEPIEWIVIATENDQAFLLSRYIIFKEKYNSNDSIDEPDWEKSTLRQWLNDTVYNSVFTNSEKKLIVQTVVTADINPESKYEQQGSATKDYIFCLSVQEVYDYGVNSSCTPVSTIPGTYNWVTRSRGSWTGGRCVGMFSNGHYSENIASVPYGIRPAMWIKSE